MWGLWGEWELWKCNPAKACMKTRRRKCNNPAPIRGGKNCADSGGQPVQSAGKVYKSTSRIHAFLLPPAHGMIPGFYFLISLRY